MLPRLCDSATAKPLDSGAVSNPTAQLQHCRGSRPENKPK